MPRPIVSHLLPRLVALLAILTVLAGPANAPSTALASTTSTGALFFNRTSSTNSPSIRIDSAGGMHVIAAGYYTGIWPGDDASQPGYYSYCAPQSDCSRAASWLQVRLDTHVQAAQIELTSAGKPRVLLQTADNSLSGYTSYWYATCDAGCTRRANWALLDVADTTTIDATVWDETKHSFALDHLGRPRFVYGSGALVYAYCDAQCNITRRDPNTGKVVPVGWRYAVVNRGLYYNEPALGFTSTNQPRLVAYVYDPNTFTFNADYFECNAICDDGAHWSAVTLMPEGSAPLGLTLRLDSTNRVGIALSQSGRVWYWQCGGTCAQPANWLWTRWDGLSARDADLVFDRQNHPHLALGTDGGPFGWGLSYISCASGCATSSSTWAGGLVESESRLAQDLPLLTPARCTAAGWFGAFRPSVALDSAANPRFASDNQFWASCLDYRDIKTIFEGVRIVYTARPAGGAASGLHAGAPHADAPLAVSETGSGPAQAESHTRRLEQSRRHEVSSTAPAGAASN